MTQQGVDYSAHTEEIVPALEAAGIELAGRYLADDWRGIFPGERQQLDDANIKIVALFESWGDQREFSGDAQGIADATFSQGKLLRTGMSPNAPVIFCTDWDAQSWELDEIGAYLQGAAEVIGLPRVGVYGGYSVIDYCHERGLATYFFQTSAWEYGRGLHPAAQLYQHAYNWIIGGTNCDDTDAYHEQYGQALEAGGQPTDDHDPKYAVPALPDYYLKVNVRQSPSSFIFNGEHWWPQRMNVKANHDTFCYSRPDVHSPYSGAPVVDGQKIAIEWAFEDDNEDTWLVNKSGFYFGGRFDPKITVPRSRHKKQAA